MSRDAWKDRDSSPNIRLGDFAALLRVLRPLQENGSANDTVDARRRLIADLCKFVAVKLGTLPPAAMGFPLTFAEPPPPKQQPPEPDPVPSKPLGPRLRQTLAHLLDGDSEKQVAYKLKLSRHTVHVYVKSLYRRFNVSSRAELMSRHLKRRA
jgi:DNA-binding CsgD family transcriptional regulator